MAAGLRQIGAILSVASKRLATQRSLVLAAAVGLSIALALVMSVPLYAEAAHFRLLREALVGERGAVDSAPLQFHFEYTGLQHGGLQWDAGLPVDVYLSHHMGADLGLPVLQTVRWMRTEALQLYPPFNSANPETQFYLTWAHLGFVNQPEKNVRLVSGTYPSIADPFASSTVEVLMPQAMADPLAIQPGDVFVLRREAVEIPVRVTGLWVPADSALPMWDIDGKETLILPEETYAGRIAAAVEDELANMQWVLVLSGARLQSGDIENLTKRIEGVLKRVSSLMAGVRLVSSPVKALGNYRQEAPALQLLLFAISTPILGLVLVFMGLVGGLFVSQQQNEIAILRSRGATIFQVAGMTALQGAVIGAAALMCGLPAAFAIAQAIGRSRSFLNFTAPAALRVMLTPLALGLGVGAMVLIFLAEFVVPTLGAAGKTIVTYKQDRARATRPPWWQRMGVDAIILLVALYGSYQMYAQQALAATDKLQVPDPLRNSQLILVPALGIFALTLGALRVMPVLMAALAWLLARTRSVGMLMASRYLARTPAFYNAPLVLLAFTLGLSVFTASVAQTLDHHLYQQVSYELGADLTVQDEGTTYNSADNPHPLFTFAALSDYAALPGVTAATWVGRYSATLLKADGIPQAATYMGVDRLTFPQVAYWQRSFSPARLSSLMNALAQYPEGVLVSRDFLDTQGIELGDLVTLSISGDSWSAGFKAVVVGVLDLFPAWYPENGPLVVGNLDYAAERAGGDFPRAVWLKTSTKADPEAIVYAVRGYTVLIDPRADQSRLVESGLNSFVESWASANQKLTAEQRRPERQGLFGLLSIGFITCALLTVLGFMLYALFSFRRRYIELGMLRAVGLSRGQLTGLLASELVLLIVTGLVLGTGLGILFSVWFVPSLQVGASLAAHYPPLQVEIAWGAVAQMYVLFGVLFVAAVSGLSVLLLRLRIFQAIKLGETT